MATNQTPLMKSYDELKSRHPDALLLFRIGDFYECFREDAVSASEILGITLTRRLNGRANTIELAGFPHHALDTYLPKLVRAGRRVAICEQLIDPKKPENTKSTEVISPNESNSSLPNSKRYVVLSRILTLLTAFSEVYNKLCIFEEIRNKTRELRKLAASINISPKRAFEECYIDPQPTLFD